MKLATAMELGRVSNLPTVWTNVLAGISLAGVAHGSVILLAMLAVSFLYLAGMFLNDACDAEWDSKNKKMRPIVRGEVSRKAVFIYSGLFTLLALLLLLSLTGGAQRAYTAVFSLALIAAIALYDIIHKRWSHSAWIMGSCRLLVYWVAASLVAMPGVAVVAAGGALLLYIAGITYLARAEDINQINNYWPVGLLLAPVVCVVIFIGYTGNLSVLSVMTLLATLVWLLFGIRYLMPGEKRNIPGAIGRLLAGLCLIDAAFLAATGHSREALFCCAAFGLCYWLQKKIAAS